MAIIITDECINCGACEPECPNTAIYEGGAHWTWAGGTSLKLVELILKVLRNGFFTSSFSSGVVVPIPTF